MDNPRNINLLELEDQTHSSLSSTQPSTPSPHSFSAFSSSSLFDVEFHPFRACQMESLVIPTPLSPPIRCTVASELSSSPVRREQSQTPTQYCRIDLSLQRSLKISKFDQTLIISVDLWYAHPVRKNSTRVLTDWLTNDCIWRWFKNHVMSSLSCMCLQIR